MPASVRREFEELFEAGFRDVRVGWDGVPGAPGPDRGGPLAATHGSEIRIAAQACHAPSGDFGRELLGHELAHVLQQRYGRVLPGADLRALEAEAVAAGRRAARGEQVRIPGRPSARARAATQFYTVVTAPNRALAGIAVPNPNTHAPTQVQDTFVGQNKGVGGAASSFLNAGAVALVSTPHGAAPIRLSANGDLAIEDCDLSVRQPKAFYATAAIVTASNDRLAMIGSTYRLVPDAVGPHQQRITVNGNVLLRVTPANNADGTAGFTTNGLQACNDLVLRVVGVPALTPRFDVDPVLGPNPLVEYSVARQLLPPPRPADLDNSTAANRGATARAIAIPYGQAAHAAAAGFVTDLQHYGVNQFVAPGVGEAFCTASLVGGVAGMSLGMGANPPTHTDYYRPIGGVNPVVMTARTWGSHWAGVVAVDGNDVITLENYARNTEDALANNDTRYYFQMYQTTPGGPGDTFHSAWTSTPMQVIPPPVPVVAGPHLPPTHRPVSPGARSFTNPVTLRMTGAEDRWDAIADTLYGAVATNTIKNDHNLIAPAATADAEVREILKGLRYANRRLAAHDRGDPARVNAWILAVGTAATAPRWQQNVQPALRAHARLVALLGM
ncbi:DUF4157 domain-containing protein [Streptomyces sp. NBC_01190]|uniref:eCIS core domain-containing protein n=1 Tax=Streptomyces sp. NBC_01190 TaxID=2903767 RepID=UPI003866546E|nr:DUF4157 domain-containing protein [Streptomyces sp. NBC_01190]